MSLKGFAMTQLGNGLALANHHEDALCVREAHLSLARRFGHPEMVVLDIKTNLANSYADLGRMEQSMQVCRDVYVGHLKLNGEEHPYTLREANNYADCLMQLNRFEEAQSLLRKIMPVARRVCGEHNIIAIRMRMNYGQVLYFNNCATLDDLREAVTTFEDTGRIARRVLGGAHPLTRALGKHLQNSRAALRVHETLSPKG